MKKVIWIILILLLTELSFAQIELKGTMGVNFLSTPSLQDYLNQNFNYELTTFNSDVVFFLGRLDIIYYPHLSYLLQEDINYTRIQILILVNMNLFMQITR